MQKALALSYGIFVVITAPVDCKWSTFGEWSSCSANCGDGIQTRNRSILIRAELCGKDCIGNNTETQACNAKDCPGIMKNMYIRILILMIRHNVFIDSDLTHTISP